MYTWSLNQDQKIYISNLIGFFIFIFKILKTTLKYEPSDLDLTIMDVLKGASPLKFDCKKFDFVCALVSTYLNAPLLNVDLDKYIHYQC